MAEKFTRWDAADYLKTEEDMALYLDACLQATRGRIADECPLHEEKFKFAAGLLNVENKRRNDKTNFIFPTPLR